MADRKIYIKNMVCPRCIMSVREIFRRNGIEPEDVQLGVVSIAVPSGLMSGPGGRRQETDMAEDSLDTVLDMIRRQLEEYGFEMIDDRRMQTVERIRTGVIEYVRDPEICGSRKLSEYIQDRCLKEYSALSKLFTEVKGMTIERYCILQKVEYVKELLFYGELSVSEIADRLHYSSVAHLSSQFKSVTGISPSAFRGLKGQSLTPIDSI